MFYILIILSSIFILTGMYIDRKRIIDGIFIKLSKIRNKEELNELETKIQELERKLEESQKEKLEIKLEVEETIEEEILEDEFEDIDLQLEEINPKDSFQHIFQESIVEIKDTSVHNKVKMIQKYEDANKSIDEMAKLMDMKKGEILLLKKLYKKS